MKTFSLALLPITGLTIFSGCHKDIPPPEDRTLTIVVQDAATGLALAGAQILLNEFQVVSGDTNYTVADTLGQTGPDGVFNWMYKPSRLPANSALECRISSHLPGFHIMSQSPENTVFFALGQRFVTIISYELGTGKRVPNVNVILMPHCPFGQYDPMTYYPCWGAGTYLGQTDENGVLRCAFSNEKWPDYTVMWFDKPQGPYYKNYSYGSLGSWNPPDTISGGLFVPCWMQFHIRYDTDTLNAEVVVDIPNEHPAYYTDPPFINIVHLPAGTRADTTITVKMPSPRQESFWIKLKAYPKWEPISEIKTSQTLTPWDTLRVEAIFK